MAINVTDVWPLGTTGSSGSQNKTGSPTTAGATIIVPVVVRSDTATVTLSDNSGTNVYTQVGTVAGGEAGQLDTTLLFYCANAASTSEIVATADEAVATNLCALIFDGIDTSDPLDVAAFGNNSPVDGSYPAVTVTPSAADNLVVGVATLPVTNRYLTQQDSSYTDLTGAKSAQTSIDVSYKTPSGTDPTGPQWDLTSGSPSGAHFLTVAFNAGEGGGPGPLSVDAGADQSLYVGQTANVSATPTGGQSPYTYAWTKVTGPSGSFLNSNQASTTFNPTGGAGTYTLRCIVTDSNSTNAQDDLTLTVSPAPEFVTVASVNDSTGWTATGGTVQQVLSDTSDNTLITSQENPTEQVLDLVMGSAQVAPGQHWVQRVRMRRVEAASGTANGYLYTGSTLHSTVSGRSIPGSMGDVDFTFPASDLEEITPQQWDDGVRFVVEVTATP